MNGCVPLARRLEEDPLHHLVPVALVGERQLVLLVVLVGDVQQDGAALKEDKVIVGVLDEGGIASVRVVLCVLALLVLALLEVEVDGFVGEAELLQREFDLPVEIVSTAACAQVASGRTSHWGQRRG